MSDAEDDYMSDKILNNCCKTSKEDDIRPGLIHNRTIKRKHEIHKKRDLQEKKPKSAHMIEEELREKGLNTAISCENKGFKLLAKMGFKPGEGLGKDKSGVKEPIKICLKKDSAAGVGRESYKTEISKRKIQIKTNHLTNMMDQYKTDLKKKSDMKFLFRDMSKAQGICEELDSRKNIQEPLDMFYWTKLTIKTMKAIDPDDEIENEEFNASFDECISEENLKSVIDYLRENHLYCIYCAFTATDEDDLRNACPGPYRIDHDDS